MKKINSIHHTRGQHWVGNGFPVRNMFGYNDLGKRISPFLLLDYAGPHDFPPSTEARGVKEHPHRGFETVTIVYSGEVEHRDSAGHSGSIGPGDVQWMTAASGVLHEEMHSRSFQQKGGRFELVQLWVNLMAKDKLGKPRYQTLFAKDIPSVDLPDDAGIVRVIAGDFNGQAGPARTHTFINLWDMRLNQGKTSTFSVPPDQTAVIFLMSGSVNLCGEQNLTAVEIVILDSAGSQFTVEASSDAKLLFLGGTPIHEPMVGLGPFVMNTRDEITQAFQDYDDGRFGVLD